MRVLRLLALLPLLAVAIAAQTVTVSDLLKNAAKFDDQIVTVSAKAFKVESKVSRIGNEYFKFRLGSEKEYVNVYGMGKLPTDLNSGDSVEVIGKFRKEKKIGDAVYKNEIEVSKKLNPQFGVKKRH